MQRPMSWSVVEGDCREVMAAMEPWSIDAIVTDPPYGLAFMDAEWDRPGRMLGSVASGMADGRGRGELWGRPGAHQDHIASTDPRAYQAWSTEWGAAALRVLKPGGHLLAFGGTRTAHRLVCGIEDAGFEIRDTVAWLYGQGFPKSRNLGDGWGTALKPAFEPIVLARAPLARSSVTANHAAFGTGGLNVDGGRLEAPGREYGQPSQAEGWRLHNREEPWEPTAGRWPPNVAMDEEAAAMLDAQTGTLVSGQLNAGTQREGIGWHGGLGGPVRNTFDASEGGASRFMYVAKADRAERDVGMDGAEERPLLWSSGTQNPGAFQSEGTKRSARNDHPTVKPIALMRWLCRLVTPPGGTVLDPFTGSGTTGIAALAEGFSFVGVERDAHYCDIAQRRIAAGSPQQEAVV